MRSVIAGDEEFYFFASWIDSDCVQASSNVVDGDLTDAVLIKHVEGVEEIEISFGRELNFAGLQLALQRALLSQGVHELVFVWDWENGLVSIGCPCCWLLMLPCWLRISLWLSSKPRLWHSWFSDFRNSANSLKSRQASPSVSTLRIIANNSISLA